MSTVGEGCEGMKLRDGLAGVLRETIGIRKLGSSEQHL